MEHAEENILSFARGVLLLLDAWPAFRIAKDHLASPSLFAELRLRLAEELVDAFTSTTLPAPDEIAGFLLEFFDGELQLALEDQSETVIARDLLLLWSTPQGPARDGMMERIAQTARSAPSYQREDGEADSDTSSPDDEGSMDLDSAKAPRPEPVVDDEGFTLVQRKR